MNNYENNNRIKDKTMSRWTVPAETIHDGKLSLLIIFIPRHFNLSVVYLFSALGVALSVVDMDS